MPLNGTVLSTVLQTGVRIFTFKKISWFPPPYGTLVKLSRAVVVSALSSWRWVIFSII